MVVIIPEGIYKMNEKRKIVKENVMNYRRSRKKEKGKILDELEEVIGYSRKYLIKLLNLEGKKVRVKEGVYVKGDLLKSGVHERGRKRKYPEELRKYLKKIWKLSGQVSSKHLKVFIEENKEWIFEGEEFEEMREEEKELICEMSSSTIERMLKEYKKRERGMFRYKRRKSLKNHIKKQIEVESFYERAVEKVGYMEIDLVQHSGSRGRGEFFYTLTAVDVMSDWTSLRVLKNKARIWTYEALREIFESVPYDVYHIHTDNGSEFINAHILSYTREMGMKQTRSRAYRKNDNALVEVKNWSMVRAYVGWRRYDTEEEYEILSRLMRLIEIKHNYFIPTMKVVKVKEEEENERDKKRKRVYDVKTPYRRLLETPDVSEEKKKELKEKKKNLSLYQLNREIKSLLQKLNKAWIKKQRKGKRYGGIDISLVGGGE